MDPELKQIWYEPIYKETKERLVRDKDKQIDRVLLQNQVDLLAELKELEAERDKLKVEVREQKKVEIQ